MKKLLLSIALMAGATCAFAVDPITVDFNDWEAFADPGETPVTKTVGDVTYQFMGSFVAEGYQGASNYLFIKGKTTKGAYVAFSLPFDCSKIVVKTSDNCSKNAGSKVNFLIDDELSETKAVNAQGAEFTFSVPSGQGDEGTTFKFESATTSYNQQFVSMTFYPTTTEASLSFEDTGVIKFATPKNGEQSKTLKILAANLTENISLSVDNSDFALSASSLSMAAAAEGVEVTYTGSTVGDATATLTISANGKTATAELSGLTVAREGTEEDPLTVSDVLTLNNMNAGPFYVTGLISDKGCGNAVDGMIGESDTPAATNMILTEGDSRIGVALPSGDARTALNIVDNPDNVGQTVIVKGTLEAYFSAPGVKNTEYISGLSSSSISEVAAEAVAAEAEYFNLQGVKVANPESGLYIRVSGNKAEKVVL